jgi:hypothetical protein
LTVVAEIAVLPKTASFITRGITAKLAYPLEVCRYHYKDLGDGKLFANLQICNIVDDVFGRETIALNSCFLAAFIPAKSEEANSCANGVA